MAETGRQGLLIVLSGPGGVGKDTLIQELLKRDTWLRYSVSFTTRPRRDYEVEGTHYSFLTEQEFRERAERGEFLEYAEVNGHLYGTSAMRVEESQASGFDVLLKIDVQGAEQVRKLRPDSLFIFMSPPTMEELMRRRHARGSESEEEMQERQRLANWEMSFADRYDYVVINDDIKRAANEVLEVIARERIVRGAPLP